MYKRRVRLGDLIKRVLLITILVAGAGALGAKVLAGYRVRSALDELVAQTAAVGDLRYLDVSTTFDGKVHIKGLSFYPRDDIDMYPLITEEAVVLTPGLLFLLGVEGGPVPPRMGVSLLGMWVDLASMAGLESTTGGSLSGNPFEAMACGDVDSFQSPDLVKMGYSPEMRMDLHLRYEMTGDNLRVAVEQSSIELSGFSLSVDVQAPNLLINPLNQSPEQIKLRGLSLQMSASEFNKRRNRFCAENAGITPDEFVQRNVRQAAAYLNRRGVEPGESVIDHYRAFMNGTGAWRLETRPEPPIGVTDIVAFDIEQLMEWLNIQSTVGGLPATTVRFDRFELTDEEDEAEQQAQDVITGSVDQRVQVAQRLDRWVTVSIAELGELVGERVRIETVRGQVFLGYLQALDSDQLVIDTRVPGGEATIPIPLSQIKASSGRQSVLDRLRAPEAEGATEDTAEDAAVPGSEDEDSASETGPDPESEPGDEADDTDGEDAEGTSEASDEAGEEDDPDGSGS